MDRLRLLPACWLSMLLFNAPVAACTGDLDADTVVDVVEIVELVNCALGEGDAGELCIEADVTMVVSAVGNALYGCAAQPVWMEITPCRQCDGCLAEEEWRPLGIVFLDERVVHWEVVCLACGCPGGPSIYALVHPGDAERLAAAGWSRQVPPR
ncbi:MAG TPA: hypothetical protein VEB21_14835 [Terriglobales bacterium]|nr:hypothetical protein [Terriglobales bacterium]